MTTLATIAAATMAAVGLGLITAWAIDRRR